MVLESFRERLAESRMRRVAELACELGPATESVEPLERMAHLDEALGLRVAAWWGWFSPLGPTECFLALVPVPKSRAWLVYLRKLHPFDPAAVVLGRVDARVAGDPAALAEVFVPLAGRGVEGYLSLPPSHVPTVAHSPLGDEGHRAFVLAAAARVGANRLASACRSLDAFWLRPWDRMNQEIYLSVSGASRRLAPDGSGTFDGPEADAEVLGRWWDRVTNPEHVAAELGATGRAWQGVIDFRRASSKDGGGQVLGWDEAGPLIERFRS